MKQLAKYSTIVESTTIGRREGLTETKCQEAGCGRIAPQVRLACPADRPDATACYCQTHGGTERAKAEAEQDWNYLAPAEVGDAADVRTAGRARLNTTEAYVVIRQTAPSQGSTWLAFLGLGARQRPVPNPQGQRRARGGKNASAGRPALAFADRGSAQAAAVDAWHRNLFERVGELARLRCEPPPFTWGTPVQLLPEPIVITLPYGDDRDPWEVARGIPRHVPEPTSSGELHHHEEP